MSYPDEERDGDGVLIYNSVCVTCAVRVWFSWLPSTGYDRKWQFTLGPFIREC